MHDYYMIIMYRPSNEVLIVLKCAGNHLPMDVLTNYANWGGWDIHHLLYNIPQCCDYNDVLQNKAMLSAVA